MENYRNEEQTFEGVSEENKTGRSKGYLALYGNQLFGTSTDIKVLLKSLAEKVRDDGKEYITIYYGEDVKEKHAQKAADLFADICPDADVNLLSGGQPVYYYLISAE